MLFVELIRRKRDGLELSREEIEWVVARYSSRELPDYQMSAFLMAALLKGLSRAETAALTGAMMRSGQLLDLSALPAPKVDKHSTGGVGDKTSLLLAPIVAAGGVYVPMVSGRGLGHTGGTLDKLESIPGFNVNLSLVEFRSILGKVGCAIMGQTAELAPADKLLYALRDVTATVESPGLICGSIMSKKLAEGIDALVLDVKTGSGAFMQSLEASESLARLLVETGGQMGKKVVALITDMDQPLGRSVGNALEVAECIELLRGHHAGLEDLLELTLELCGWMFALGRRTPDKATGRALAQELICSGAALAKLRQLVAAQGGDAASIDDPLRLPQAAYRELLRSPATGYIAAIACERIGMAGVLLGAGRLRTEDAIDPAVGIVLHKKVGEPVAAGEPLCTVHYNDSARLSEALAVIGGAYRIGCQPPPPRALVQMVIEDTQ